ncbi:major royal jelly family protein [Herbiconiux daphne]|uniref:Major royal jelly family protein n=1 Tax=Herbiconiux daphne TaxID=2970914 RepID=A0ABT2H0D7_9MICO|nr:major royal jelly family protein [Herbiconiux daphne]MCS5732884.1 major royal jelly family protein [Herbiconiux daphne]
MPSLRTELTLDFPCTGVSSSPGGRLFIVQPRIDGTPGPQISEIVEGSPTPFPDEEWNSWEPGKDAATHFVRANAQRVGPDGALWVVDVGGPGLGGTPVKGGPKLVKISLGSNVVERVYLLDDVTSPRSGIDDVRFNATTAYLTDAGDPGLIVLDLATGAARRALDGDVTTTAGEAVSAEGAVLRDVDGAEVLLHADQLEVSPDGSVLYFQACCGPLWAVPTKAIDDSELKDADLAKLVVLHAQTTSTGGTAIGADGTIFISDTNARAIWTIAPTGERTLLIQDDRLLWVDAMWIDAANRLWLPAAELNRMTIFSGAPAPLESRLHVYSIDVGVGPANNDHL